MLIKKIISSIIVLSLAISVALVFPDWVYLLVTVLFVIAGLNEFFSMMQKKGLLVYKYFGMTVGALIPVFSFLHYGGNQVDLEPLLIVLACLLTFVMQFTRKDPSHSHIISIAVTLLGLFYIGWLFSFFIKLKFLADGGKLVLFLIFVTKSGDVNAYFFGKTFGRHKLIPRISPNKTIEGTVAGLLTSVLVSVLLKDMIGISLAHGLMIGLTLSVLGQTGDLAESLVKRDSGVKDAGEMVPGFGGVLDVIDSLLFTAPIFYFYMKNILPLN